jgi:hypothetical protein
MILDDDNRLIIGKGVKLKPYSPREYLPRQYMTENEIRSHAGDDLIADVESFPNYYLAGFKHIQSRKYIRLENDFNPFMLSWMLNSYRTIGFNSNTFDLVVLWASYINRDPTFLKNIADALIRHGKRKEEVEKEFGFKCYKLQPRQHIDLFNVCPLKGSLKLYGARLHSPRIQDLPFADNKDLEDWQIPIVQEYNCNDLDVTEQIFKFCKERLELRESISIEYNLDLMSKSDAQMAEAVISQEVSKLNGRYVTRPTIEAGTTFKYRCPQFLSFATPQMQELFEKIKKINFVIGETGKVEAPEELKAPVKIGDNYYQLGIGGLHSCEKSIGYEANDEYDFEDTDVVSYYPRAIDVLELFPIAMGPNFLTVYRGFRHQRVEAKRLKNFTKDKGLKIFLNGTSGKFSDFWSKMYSPELTIHLNLTGQLSILMYVEMLECNGIRVISANTDGVVVYYKKSQREQLNYWHDYWQKLTGFEFEYTKYQKYYCRDVNGYFAVKENGEVKVKGSWSEVGSQSGTQLDNNPNMLICSDAIKAFLSKQTPIEETIKQCRDITRFVVVRNVKGGAHFRNEYLGRVVRWYYSNKSYDSIHYVTNNNRVAETENCMPCMDLPTQIPDDLDYQRYINETKNILYDIGYYKRSEQTRFF